MTTTDIDWATPRATQTTRRQCCVCGLTYVVSLDYDGPPLCEPCRSDIPAARARLQHLLDGVDDQEASAYATWQALCTKHLEYWERICAARKLPGFAEKAEKHRAAHNTYGVLLEAEAAYERATAALSEERARLERALEILWDAEDHSKDEWII